MLTKNARETKERKLRGKPKAAAPSPKAKVPTVRRVGAENSETRDVLLNAAEQLMRDEGYAAVTSRRLGAKAGVNPQLVHYYFSTMDNLFLEIWRRFAQHNIARQTQALLSHQPLRDLWACNIDYPDASLNAELMAAARHRKQLRTEIARTVENFRRMQAGILSHIMDDHGLKREFFSPEVLSIFLMGLARILVIEDEFGISSGNSEARKLIENWIDHLESRRSAAEAAPTGH